MPLKDRADRALGGLTVNAAINKVRAIIGPTNVPDSEPLAQAALTKLHNGEDPTAEELTALEIVVRLLRPVMFSRNGILEDLPEADGHAPHPAELKDTWSKFRDRLKSRIGSIGRIETAAGKHVGTGFMVGDGLLATNRHVLGALTFGSEALAAGAARVVFKQESGLANASGDIVPIDGVAAIHRTLDMVLLAVAKQGRPAIPVAPVSAGETLRVVTVGFPANDPANNPLFLAGLFQGRFGFKSAALGEVLDGVAAPSLFHDCSTTQGNSGSPLFSLDSAEAVGIHRAGFFMYRNEAVDAAALRSFISSHNP